MTWLFGYAMTNNLLHYFDMNFVTIVNNPCQHPVLFYIFDEVLPC